MKPFYILILSFFISLFVFKTIYHDYEWDISGRIAMSVMLLFTAVSHFFYTKGMEMMLPDFIPGKTFVIYATGIIELAAAVGLLIPGLQIVTGWLLIIFFIFILPANIYAAIKRVDFQKSNYYGNGLNYLWFRIPLQLFFVAWTYFFSIMY